MIFEPLTLLEKLAALTPRPRINLVLYHGVLAPHSGWRARVVAGGALAGEAPVAASASADANDEPPPPGCRHYAWAALMRRAFGLDVLVCPRCGGRLRLQALTSGRGDVRALAASAPAAIMLGACALAIAAPAIVAVTRSRARRPA